ncbi:MAG: hypothetical protein PHS45_01170 [Bacilli bacterium]|nr:hypothetical protein [Bacilli bacterium]
MAIRVKDLNVVTTRLLVSKNVYNFYKDLGLGVGIVVNNQFIGVTTEVSTPVVEKDKCYRDILEPIPTGGIYATDIYKVENYDYYRPRNQKVTLEVMNEIIKDLQKKGHDVIAPINGEVTKEEFKVWQSLIKEAAKEEKLDRVKSKVLSL